MAYGMVKNKYTYERVRQTDYRFAEDRWALSQNRLTGRLRYETGDRIADLRLTAGERVPLDLPRGERLRDAAGLRLQVRASSAPDARVRVALFGEAGESFLSVLPAEEGTHTFSTALMDFLPVRAEAEVSAGTLSGTLSIGYVLDTLGETGGQARFYRASHASLLNRGGEMTLRADGTGAPSLESPVFPDTAATAYNMRMPRRNTVFAVLRNGTTASRARLYFTTYAFPEWSEEASAEVPLTVGQPDAAAACYFNLSASPRCLGRLRQFRLVLPEDARGDLTVVRYSFEQEQPLREVGCRILSCAADRESGTVTVSGMLLGTPDLAAFAAAGGDVCAYATTMATESETPEGKRLLGRVPIPAGGQGPFAVRGIPLSDGVTTLLPYQFAVYAECEGRAPLWLCDRFYIENYEDFDGNPYAFDLPDRTVSVADFDACGDAVHDDTEAFQAALDHVAAAGGGVVCVPGSDGPYGRRYLLTNLLLPSFTELRLGRGAVLWQSQLRSHYPYEPAYGHDGVLPGVNWAHHHLISNLPLLQAAHATHIRITGPGTIRMMDTGSEEGVDMPGYASGCPDRIHVIPIGFFCVEDCECRDFEIVRANNYHTEFNHGRRLYLANLRLHEVKCVSGDGLGLCGAHQAKINRCFLQSNDDGVVLSTHYSDPRGILWWTDCEEVNGVRDVTVVHSYLNSGGGKALAFIPWGTSDPNQEREEIAGVYASDNVLAAVNPVGTWCDNPYHGRQPFDNAETEDYSPVKDVRILGNRYEGTCTLLSVQATNVLTDCGVHSTDQFRNGDFTLGGMANWTLFPNADPDSVRSVLYAGKKKGYIDRFDRGAVRAAQGLRLPPGRHTVRMEILADHPGVELFVSRVETGETVASQTARCPRPRIVRMDFETGRDGEDEDVFVGLRSLGSDPRGYAVFDRCEILSDSDGADPAHRRTEAFRASLERDFEPDGAWTIRAENGRPLLILDAIGGERVLTARGARRLLTVEVSARAERYGGGEGERGFGIRFAERDGGASFRELRFSESSHALRLLDREAGRESEPYLRERFSFTSSDFHMFRLEVTDAAARVSVDGAEYAVLPMRPIAGRASLIVRDACVTLGRLSVTPAG